MSPEILKSQAIHYVNMSVSIFEINNTGYKVYIKRKNIV